MTGHYRWPEIDMAELHAYRSARVAEIMRETDLAALVLVGPDNIRYATDFRAHLTNESEWFTAVVRRDGDADVFVPYIDEVISQPFAEAPWIRSMRPLASWAPVTANPATWTRDVAALLADVRGRIGVDGVDLGLLERLRGAHGEADFVSVSAALQRVRREKHPLEVTLLRAASRVNAGAMQAALAAAEVGGTDHDVLAAAMHFQQSAGAEFVTHSVCNLRNGSGDWFAAGRRFAEGDPFFFDIGMYGVGGYGSDAARTGFVGEPTRAVREAYEALVEAHGIAQSIIRPGVKASAVLAAVNEHLEGRGLRGTPYGVGHGVGLRICELPTVFTTAYQDEDVTFIEGEVIALEPETTVIDRGRETVLKIEDNFVVTATGLEQLTLVPAEQEFVAADRRIDTMPPT
jgi:Xaa-Pro aminopeptidase